MLLFLVLFALWLLLNGQVTLELILIGAAVSGAVWLFCYRTLGYRPQREPGCSCAVCRAMRITPRHSRRRSSRQTSPSCARS